LPDERNLLLVGYMDRCAEKAFSRSVAAYWISGNVLICSSKKNPVIQQLQMESSFYSNF
jgi:hypothetical protein